MFDFLLQKVKLIDQNGENFRYRLKMRRVVEPEEEWIELNFPPFITSFNIPGAGFHVKYELQLQGVNNVGAGPVCSKTAYSGQSGTFLLYQFSQLFP